MFDTSRRALLRSVGAAAGVPFVVRRGLARENQAGSGLVTTGSASADGRRVTFAGSIDPAARGGDWEAVGFWFADYNGFWYPTPVKRLGEFSGTSFGITATVPYSRHVFPYFAYLTDDADAAREVTSFDADDSWPAERGEIRRVTVPSTADTVSVRTVDVIPSETGATVRGRIEEYGKALDIDAGAHYGEKFDYAGPYSTVVEKSPGDDPRFQVEFRDLEPDTEYTVRAVAAVPAGPVSDTAFGNDVTVTTGPRPDTGTRTLGVESRGGGVAAYEAVLSGDVSLGDAADGNEIRGREGGSTLVRGHVGPDRGRDDFTYDGDVEALVLAGPARVDVDGYEIAHDAYPAPTGSVTASDLAAGGGTNTLEIRSTGGGIAAYELAVDGELRATGDVEESVGSNRVEGHLGPDRGRDTFEFEGDVYDFRLAGPAVVSLNGTRIESDG